MPCVPAGMPLYSQLIGDFGFTQVPSFAFTVQKSGHFGFSGGHEMALDWSYNAYPMKIMDAISAMIAMIMMMR
jgi:hypothetical protein